MNCAGLFVNCYTPLVRLPNISLPHSRCRCLISSTKRQGLALTQFLLNTPLNLSISESVRSEIKYSFRSPIIDILIYVSLDSQQFIYRNETIKSKERCKGSNLAKMFLFPVKIGGWVINLIAKLAFHQIPTQFRQVHLFLISELYVWLTYPQSPRVDDRRSFPYQMKLLLV